jgi:hypothetical protein
VAAGDHRGSDDSMGVVVSRRSFPPVDDDRAELADSGVRRVRVGRRLVAIRHERDSADEASDHERAALAGGR